MAQTSLPMGTFYICEDCKTEEMDQKAICEHLTAVHHTPDFKGKAYEMGFVDARDWYAQTRHLIIHDVKILKIGRFKRQRSHIP